jgi:oligopeptide/dipeptide ABC transporter ATP-binding protein
MNEPLLELRDLTVDLCRPEGNLRLIQGVNLTLRPGEVMGVVGESGSGKSVTMRAVLGLLPRQMRVTGSARFSGREVLGLPPRALQALRGARISIIFQDPMTALNPVMTIGAQIVEAIRIHDRAITGRGAAERALALLDLVAIPMPVRRMTQYPHEFSGGMRQRVAIAMSMANNPDLLIADEPTTALDVTVQAQIMDVLRRLRDERGVGIILITHDLGLVAGIADHVAVMYAGRVVESADVRTIFAESRHPYTRGLLASLPKLDEQSKRLFSIGGAPPALARRPTGCAFHPRCAEANGPCHIGEPPLRPVDGDAAHLSACHFADLLGVSAPLVAG